MSANSDQAPQHGPVVAIIGGATAGAEVAGRLAELGCTVVVFEQNPRPYGKIEDGLPRWHEALRNKEYQAIGTKLSMRGVHFVPNTKVGEDIDLRELVDGWGFTAVVLACGAWRDRALPIEGADAYLDKGLVYQNPFVISFNHAGDPTFEGERFDIPDDAIVVGGGLASIDVAKILMLENTKRALAERGIETTILKLEVKGIPKVLAGHDLRFEDLGVDGCTIFYRRSVKDMPLMEIPEGATPERIEKARNGRERMLGKAMDKYQFKLEPLSAPDGLIVEDDRLVGLRFRRTRIEAGRVIPTEETYEARGSRVISSIGSIPEPIEGIPMKGELFGFQDWDIGRIDGFPTLFSVGNVVTGKGNIVASRKHAAAVSKSAIEAFLGLGEDGDRSAESELAEGTKRELREAADQIRTQIADRDAGDTQATLERVATRQQAVGYPGDFKRWIDRAGTPS